MPFAGPIASLGMDKSRKSNIDYLLKFFLVYNYICNDLHYLGLEVSFMRLLYRK